MLYSFDRGVALARERAPAVGVARWGEYGAARLGDEAAFTSMCSECKRCGVDVLVDVVINHMAEGSGSVTAGTTFGGRITANNVFPLSSPSIRRVMSCVMTCDVPEPTG